MPRTAPIPNLPARPGMCQAVLSKAGGSGGGDSGAGGGRGKGKKKAKGKRGNENAKAGKKNAAEGTGKCGGAGHLPLIIERSYNGLARERDVGLGFGWSHSLSWA